METKNMKAHNRRVERINKACNNGKCWWVRQWIACNNTYFKNKKR